MSLGRGTLPTLPSITRSVGLLGAALSPRPAAPAPLCPPVLLSVSFTPGDFPLGPCLAGALLFLLLCCVVDQHPILAGARPFVEHRPRRATFGRISGPWLEGL